MPDIYLGIFGQPARSLVPIRTMLYGTGNLFLISELGVVV